MSFGLLGALAACKAKIPVDTDAAGFRKGEKKVDASADANPAPGGSVNSNGGGVQPAQTPSTPTSYLLSNDDAIRLKPIFEAYRTPEFTDPGGNFTQSFEKYRQFTESFLNRALALRPLVPGRTINVHIADDQQVNAYAGPFQDVVINAGTIAAADSTQLLAVLCHELGHSARNHSLKTADYQGGAALVGDINRFYEAREDYIKKTYDAGSQTYTHNAAGFAAVNRLWGGIKPRLDVFGKREESEADVVGAEICGHLGMPTDTYISALSGFLTTGDATDAANAGADAKTVEQIVEGDRFQLDQDSLKAFLFPSDSHPSNGERRDQLLRLRNVVATHFDPVQGLFNEWKNGYQGAKGLGLVGLSLTEAVQQNTLTIHTEGGKVIKIKRPHLCGGRR